MKNFNTNKKPMVTIFTTNIPNQYEASDIMSVIRHHNPGGQLSFDIENAVSNYPCDHSILRVEGEKVNPQNIMTMVNQAGFECDILEDKVCS